MGVEGNSHVDFDGSPMPTDVLAHDAILDIGRAVIERGEGVIQLLSHIVTYGDRSISERMAEAARGSGARLMHNSFLPIDRMPEKTEENLTWLDAQRAKGCDITVSSLLHRAWLESSLRQLDVPAGQLAAVRKICACASDGELMRLIADPEFQRAFIAEYDARGPTHGAGLETQTVIDVGDNSQLAPYLDRTLLEIARQEGRDVVTVLLDLALRSKLALQLKSGQIIAADPAQIVRLMSHCAVIGGSSDGGAHTKSFGVGHYATDLLLWLVRDERRMTLEDMHFQLALKPARAVQIYDRGALLPGFWADVLVYDLDVLYFDRQRYQIVHDMPNGDWRRKGRAGGYDYILVNGVVTHHRDLPTGATPGRLVRVCKDRRRPHAAAA
jgi:N-acyl-D-aspartate/D-glutamate deacylase